ncbi:hypothetical protein DYB34_001357 [Aphanomyces astaci]|uniref:NLE domain-containing protein n=1 Tax=Aphanomyces astaci TaxID=112090 RepID=A0A418C1N6_APHAT|nr:hypothetical protein DYB34_001357 [Aphanomyces astaci]
MSTVDRAAKKQKVEAENAGSDSENEDHDDVQVASVIAQFKNEQGESVGPQLDIPVASTVLQMEELVNQLLDNGRQKVPYSFYLNDTEITDTLAASVRDQNASTEAALTITFQPLAVFRVRPVTRCTDTLQGHSEAILHVRFSPDGKKLASGGGDATVRFWDTNTCMPQFTGRGHKHHVLCTAWSPDGSRFASADKIGEIRNSACERFASSSKDGSIKIWNARTGRQCLKWGGEGLLYSASRDRTIKVWAVEGDQVGKLVRTLVGHAHRINTLALNVDYVCRTGPYDHTFKTFDTREEMQQAAQARYDAIRRGQPERLVSGSDDFTLFLWEPASKKPIERLTGHQQPVNDLSFSPDGRYFASASFDKKVKIWNGKDGKFVATLNGHVGAVYQVCWSSDSRMIVSASKDSTIKVWELANLKNAKETLSGHADEVYALDWSPNGQKVASGSKDRTIKMYVRYGKRVLGYVLTGIGIFFLL